MPDEEKFPEQKYKIGQKVWYFDYGKFFLTTIRGVKNINEDTNEYLVEYRGKLIEGRVDSWVADNYLYADKTDLLVAIRDYIVEEERR